jgi:hypothetical protein
MSVMDMAVGVVAVMHSLKFHKFFSAYIYCKSVVFIVTDISHCQVTTGYFDPSRSACVSNYETSSRNFSRPSFCIISVADSSPTASEK